MRLPRLLARLALGLAGAVINDGLKEIAVMENPHSASPRFYTLTASATPRPQRSLVERLSALSGVGSGWRHSQPRIWLLLLFGLESCCLPSLSMIGIGSQHGSIEDRIWW